MEVAREPRSEGRPWKRPADHEGKSCAVFLQGVCVCDLLTARTSIMELAPFLCPEKTPLRSCICIYKAQPT